MWECHFLLTHVCDCLQSFFPGKRDKDVLGIHKRKETNVCCVQLNVGVSHKFSVCVCVCVCGGGGGEGGDTDKEAPVLFKTSAHRA